MFTLLRRSWLEDEHARFYALQLATVFVHLHANQVVHRQATPENILIDMDGHIRLGGFSFAKIVDHRTYTFVGMPEYLAPEILLNKGHSSPVDWWIFGILVYEMVVGHPPFAAEAPMGIYDKIMRGRFDTPSRVRLRTRNLARGLLTPRVAKRLSSLSALYYFHDVEWASLLAKRWSVPYLPNPDFRENFGEVQESEQAEEDGALPPSADPFLYAW